MFSGKFKYIAIIISLFLSLSVYYEMYYWLIQRPCSVHVWRQTDCASYALNYYLNNRSFFNPQVHHRHAIEGSTVSEFPIIYYIASKMYGWFGFHDYYIRWLNYIIFFSAFLAVYFTSRIFIRDSFLAMIPSLLMMMSCVLVYYGSNYLPDAPALSFALIGFYFISKYHIESQNSDFYVGTYFVVLASLLKISSALIFISFIAFSIYQRVVLKNDSFNYKKILTLFLGLFILAGWVFYVKYYNQKGQYFGNLQGTLGIWLCTAEQIDYIIDRTKAEWMPALASKKLWYLIIPVFLYIIWYWRKLHVLLRFFILLLIAGSIFYLIAWFAVFDVHDYYFINILCLPVIISIAFFSLLEMNLDKKYLKVFYVSAAILLVMTAEDTKAQFEYRRYNEAWNSQPAKAFYKIEPYLRSIGIDRNELIYSPSDYSTNITLYFANNPGFTRLFDVSAENAYARGAKYMLLLKDQLESEEFSAFKNQVIGEFEDIAIVKF